MLNLNFHCTLKTVYDDDVTELNVCMSLGYVIQADTSVNDLSCRLTIYTHRSDS